MIAGVQISQIKSYRYTKQMKEYWGYYMRGRSTIFLTRPFLRLTCTLNFPLLKLCSIKERLLEFPLCPSIGWAICSKVAFIEDMYSSAAVARVSCRSECNSQNKLETWPCNQEIKSWEGIPRWIYDQAIGNKKRYTRESILYERSEPVNQLYFKGLIPMGSLHLVMSPSIC